MKVVVVTTRHRAQDDRIYHKQALSLAKRFNVTLVAPDDAERHQWPVGVTYRPIRRRRSPLGRLRSVIEAVRAIRNECPEFCHLHDLDLALAIPLIRLTTNAKIIYDSHEVFTRENLRLNARVASPVAGPIAWLAELVENTLVAGCQHVVTAVEAEGHAFRGVRVPLSAVYNYPPLAVFETEPDEVRAAAEPYRGRLPIIYQGSMSPNRGLYHMLEAVAQVKALEPRVLLRLVGMEPGALWRETERRVVEAGLETNVEIGGWLPPREVALAMKTSLLGLVPLQPWAKYERALPIKLLEYMACGLPVIAAKLAVVERYMTESRAGVVYDSTRPEELARSILELLPDQKRREEMGRLGEKAVRERWNWGTMETVLFGIYESLGGPAGVVPS